MQESQFAFYLILALLLHLFGFWPTLIGVTAILTVGQILALTAPKTRAWKLQVRGGEAQGRDVIWLDAPQPAAGTGTATDAARVITWSDTTTKTIEAPADSTTAMLTVARCRRCRNEAELSGGYCLDCHLAGRDAGYRLIAGMWVRQPVQDAQEGHARDGRQQHSAHAPEAPSSAT